MKLWKISFIGLVLVPAAGCRFFSSSSDPKETPVQASLTSGVVFVLSGQSNMAGQTPFMGYENQIRVPNVKMFCIRPYQFNADRETLKQGEPPAQWSDVISCGADPGKTFGPEVMFAKEMARALPSTPIYLIKYAHGGTSQGCEWQPKEKSQAYLNYGDSKCKSFVEGTGKTIDAMRSYDRLLTVVQWGLNGLAKDAIRPRFGGILWFQGEGDADGRSIYRFLPENYGQNLNHFIFHTRKDLGQPQAPFVLGMIKCGYDKAEWNPQYSPLFTVRQGQIAAAKNEWNIYTFDTWDLKFQADGCHFDGPSMEEVGRRFSKVVTGLK
jgi:hypothetical protein